MLSHDQVHAFLATVGSGVEGAREGSPSRHARHSPWSSRRTVPDVSKRMATFMAAMWQGSGRSLADFPGDVPLTTMLDETSLSLLLASQEISDEEFWRRIRPLVDIRVLLNCGATNSQNLQHLMRSAIRHWKGHVCMVVDDPERAATSQGHWRWTVDNGRLGVHAHGRIAYLAASRKDLDFPDEHQAPLLAQVRRRASRFGIRLTAIRMLMTNRSIEYDAPGQDVTQDPQLDGISASLGQEEGVVEAMALTATGAPLRCGFTSRTASPPGARSLLPYSDLLGTTLRLVLFCRNK